ncbi:TPA: aminotransferase class I/II-fold pyridoxal phosphate-dependent enzyme, partial [Vibrio cholerae]
ALADQFAQAKKRMAIDTTIFPQVLANIALRSSDYHQQQRTLLAEMAQRQQDLLQLLQAFQEDWQWQSTKGGLYLWLTWRHRTLTRKDWSLFLA